MFMTNIDFKTTGRVQFITHTTAHITYQDSVRMALAGGCRWIQLRMKEATVQEVEAVAREVMPLCRAVGAKFLIDDHVALAFRLGADGVHLGKNDMPVDEARRQTSPHFIIGGTANTMADIQRLARLGADYIGCGPFRFTTTKKNLSPTLGLNGYRTIVSEMRRQGIHLPIVAIGGIGYDDINALMQTGLSGIALSGSILRATDPVAEMQRVVECVMR